MKILVDERLAWRSTKKQEASRPACHLQRYYFGDSTMNNATTKPKKSKKPAKKAPAK
jgi:hypothetical protein